MTDLGVAMNAFAEGKMSYKPCPFCGCVPEYVPAYGVECSDCGAKVPATLDGSMEAWNTRHSTEREI